MILPSSFICVLEHDGNALSKKSKTNFLSYYVILDAVKRYSQ